MGVTAAVVFIHYLLFTVVFPVYVLNKVKRAEYHISQVPPSNSLQLNLMIAVVLTFMLSALT